MWWRRLFLLLSLTFLCCAHAQVITKALTPFLDVEGGKALNLVVAFENTSDTDITIEAEIELPSAWRVLIPLGQVTIAASSESIVPFTISVPKSVLAGDYTVFVSTVDQSSEVEFVVNVAQVSSLEVAFINFPQRMIAQPYTVEAVMTNSGNQELLVDVHIDDNLGFALSPQQLQVILEPQQHQSIEIHVTPPEVFNVQRKHGLRIQALDAETQEQISITQKFLTLIPTERSEYVNWQLFPVVLNISKSRWSLQGNPLDAVSLNVSGRGRLTDADNSLLEFRVNTDALLQRQRFSVKYTKPQFSVLLANTTASLPRVGIAFRNTDTVQAAGYYNLKIQDNFLLTPYFYVSGFDLDSWRAGLRSNYVFSSSSSVSGMLEANYLNRDLLLITKTSYNNWFSDFRTQLSAEYFAHLKDNAEVAGQFTTSVRSNNGTHIFNSNYKHIQEGYKDRDNSTSTLNFSYTLKNQELKSSIRVNSYNQWEYSSSPDNDTRQEHRFEATANYTIGENNWRFETEYTTFPAMQENNNLKTTIQLFQRYNSDSYLRQRLNFIHNFAKPDDDRLRYYASLVYPLGDFELESSVNFEVKPYEVSLVNFVSDVDLSTDTDFGSIAFTASYKPFNNDYFKLNTTVDFDITNQSRLGLAAGVSFSETSDVDLYVSAAYTHRFHVPVSKKTKVATVSGYLRDGKGQALANILVEVSGQFVQTDSEGQFQLTNILPGDTYFQVVEGQLPKGQITIPASPYFFNVEAQQTYNLEFTVVDSASIQLQARYEEVAAKDDTIVEKVKQINLFNRLEVVLTSEQGEALKLRTNDLGYVAATELIAGKWRIRAYLVTNEGNIDIQVSHPELTIREGEEVNIDIVLRPKERKLKITDGGSVTFEPNQEK